MILDSTLRIPMKISFKEWNMSGFWSSESFSKKKDFKILLNEKKVENKKEKQMYWQFIRDMPEGMDKEKS